MLTLRMTVDHAVPLACTVSLAIKATFEKGEMKRTEEVSPQRDVLPPPMLSVCAVGLAKRLIAVPIEPAASAESRPAATTDAFTPLVGSVADHSRIALLEVFTWMLALKSY